MAHLKEKFKVFFVNRCGSFLINLVVGISQLVTVVLCLVGWCWSVGWGITLITVASKYEHGQRHSPLGEVSLQFYCSMYKKRHISFIGQFQPC